MNENDLKSLGLNDDQIAGVISKFKEELDGKFVTKEVFNSTNEELKKAKSDIVQRDTQIKELNDFAKDNDALKQKIASITEQNDTAMKKYEAELAMERLKSKIRSEIMSNKEHKAHDLDLVLSQLDIDNIKFENNKLVGFKEQYDKLTAEKSFLFQSNEEHPEKVYKGFTPFDGNKPNSGAKEILGKRLAIQALKEKGIKIEE